MTFARGLSAVAAALLVGIGLLWSAGSEPPESTAEQNPIGGEATLAVPTLPDLNYNLREGRTQFLYYCAPCHGETGRGDGFNSYSLEPRPRDLTDAELQASRTDEDLADVIGKGGAALGLSTGMPPWGRTLNDRQIDNLVAYVRRLAQEP